MSVASHSRAERWELYKLLAEPLRLRLLALTAVDELAVSELAELLGESQPNVSRHAAVLRQAGLVVDRRQGTWTLLRLDSQATEDPVICDALATGKTLCEREGLLGRVTQIVRARDKSTREFFARARATAASWPAEGAAYVMALSALLPSRKLAVDAGTGDGAALEALAPAFEQVIGIDRSDAQLSACRERLAQRALNNVTLLCGELDDRKLVAQVQSTGGAELVLAARVLHHAPKPAETMRALAKLCAAGGAVVVLDYARHEDEALRTQQADLWLGFEAHELREFFREAGLTERVVLEVPSGYRGNGPDRNVPWVIAVGVKTCHGLH
jgi:ArsR family transcriptional regulator